VHCKDLNELHQGRLLKYNTNIQFLMCGTIYGPGRLIVLTRFFQITHQLSKELFQGMERRDSFAKPDQLCSLHCTYMYILGVHVGEY